MELRGSVLRRARRIYVTPAHQCPLGVAMSLPRRLALLAWARKTGALVFEDDYDSEYRYSGRPLPALQASVAPVRSCSPAASARCCSRRCGWGISSSRRIRRGIGELTRVLDRRGARSSDQRARPRTSS
jgi:hypothetical protein